MALRKAPSHMADKTTIQVSGDLWQELNRRKQPGDTFEDVLRRELGLTNESNDNDSRKREATGAETADVQLHGDGVPEGVDPDAAREAIQAVLELVRADGGVQRTKIVETVMPKHPLKYDAPADASGYKGAWWRKIVRPGLEANGCRYINGTGWVDE